MQLGHYTPTELPPIRGLQIKPSTDPRLCERIEIIDSRCLAVKYDAKFYNQYVRNFSESINRAAYYYDMMVGSLSSRFEQAANPEELRVYILTLGVLEPYRKMGIGRRLVEDLLLYIHTECPVRVSEVYLHVQDGTPTPEFYRRNNFEVINTLPNYYTDLEQKEALVMRIIVPQPHLEKKKK